MVWVAVAATIVAFLLGRLARRTRRRIGNTALQSPVHRLRPGIDVPRQWHPVRPQAAGDMWVLGASAALLAEREHRRNAVEDSGAAFSDSEESDTRDHDHSWMRDDFSGGGGSSGGGGASGDWSSDSSGSGSDSSDGGGD
ncbi:hypothetical protein KX816_11425 [Sphingosinicellaceae bacterium]|nr:hypothetical protein KX816_11425 [Sphingosinicellaceae bacterium]